MYKLNNMGMSVSVYVGPYLKVVSDLTSTVTKTKKACVNGHKVNSSKFCPDCGKETVNIEFEVKEKRYILWTELESEDDLWSPEGFSKILLPTSNRKGSIRVRVENSEETNLTDVDITGKKVDEIKWFHKEYDKYIRVLKSFYGEDNIEICWGIISYWS